MTERLLRMAEVMARTGLSRPTIYRWMAEGAFPKPVSLGPKSKTVAWLESEVQAFIADAIEASRRD